MKTKIPTNNAHGRSPCLPPAAYIHLAKTAGRRAPQQPVAQAIVFVFGALIPAGITAIFMWIILALIFAL